MPGDKVLDVLPGGELPVLQVTYLSNYSPYMTPDKDTHYSLLCETSYSEFKPVDAESIVEDTIQGLVNAASSPTKTVKISSIRGAIKPNTRIQRRLSNEM